MYPVLPHADCVSQLMFDIITPSLEVDLSANKTQVIPHIFLLFMRNVIYLLTALLANLLTGVPRETEQEKNLADFDIFDDPESPFSTFNFQYSNEAFTRLHDLMEFNTLNNLEVSSAPVISPLAAQLAQIRFLQSLSRKQY